MLSRPPTVGQFLQHPGEHFGGQVLGRFPVSQVVVDVAIESRIVGVKHHAQRGLIQRSDTPQQLPFFAQYALLCFRAPWVGKHVKFDGLWCGHRPSPVAAGSKWR
jgi:hypothetical protein